MPRNFDSDHSLDKEQTISASEINRYVYCNYQWYYQRTYGAAELARRKKAHLENLGIQQSDRESPLERGRRYHADFGCKNKSLWRTLRRFAAVLAIGLLLYLLYIMLQTDGAAWPWM